MFAENARFGDLGKVPGRDGKSRDGSRLPLAEDVEELLQLNGIDGRVSLRNDEESYRVTLSWQKEHFPSLLLWMSNRGRKAAPWSGRHVGLGMEPICSPFGLGIGTALLDNPIAASGTPTTHGLPRRHALRHPLSHLRRGALRPVMRPSLVKPNRPQFTDLAGLAAMVEDGESIGVGGHHFARLPIALIAALAARQPKSLRYVSWAGGLALEMLLEAAAVGEIDICFSSLDIFGLPPRFRAVAECGAIPVRDWNALAMIEALRAREANLASRPFQFPPGPT